MTQMDNRHVELSKAIKRGLLEGQPAMEVAVSAWEQLNGGRRAGVNAALLALARAGMIQAEIVGDGKGVRQKVLDVVSVNERIAVVENVNKSRRVFVVHGRDEDLRTSMFAFLRSINLHPMEWSELTASHGSGAAYIGEILDQAFEKAQAVVVMFTPDEETRLVDRLGNKDEGFQARPNVIFEAGLALARNPNSTVLVEIGRLRTFSDVAGRHTVRLDDEAGNRVARRQDLANRLLNAGCDVSLKGTDWHSIGRFVAH